MNFLKLQNILVFILVLELPDLPYATAFQLVFLFQPDHKVYEL